MTDEERGAFERIQKVDPSWVDVGAVLRTLARKALEDERRISRLEGDAMARALSNGGGHGFG